MIEGSFHRESSKFILRRITSSRDPVLDYTLPDGWEKVDGKWNQVKLSQLKFEELFQKCLFIEMSFGVLFKGMADNVKTILISSKFYFRCG